MLDYKVRASNFSIEERIGAKLSYILHLDKNRDNQRGNSFMKNRPYFAHVQGKKLGK